MGLGGCTAVQGRRPTSTGSKAHLLVEHGQGYQDTAKGRARCRVADTKLDLGLVSGKSLVVNVLIRPCPPGRRCMRPIPSSLVGRGSLYQHEPLPSAQVTCEMNETRRGVTHPARRNLLPR